MGHLIGFSFTINFGGDCFKYNTFLQSLKSILYKLSKCLCPAISEIYQNNGNNITLSNISSYYCITRFICLHFYFATKYTHVLIAWSLKCYLLAIFSSWKYNIHLFSFEHILFTTAYEWDWATCYTKSSSLLFHAQYIHSVISVWVCTNNNNNIRWLCSLNTCNHEHQH